MERSLSGDARAIKRRVRIVIQRRPNRRHHPDDQGLPIGFFLIVDRYEQRAVPRLRRR